MFDPMDFLRVGPGWPKSISLTHQLVNGQGERELTTELKSLLSSVRFEELDCIFQLWFERYPSALTDSCRSVSQLGIRLSGWDGLHADFLCLEKKVNFNLGRGCAAVGLDLINRSDTPNLCLQNQFYNEEAFADSGSTREELLASLARDHPHWRRGYWREGNLEIHGLEELTSSLRAFQCQRIVGSTGEAASLDYVCKFLAEWYLLFCVQRSVFSDLRVHGMPKSLPVYVGMDRLDRPMEVGVVEYGPDFQTVYWADANISNAASIEQILEHRGVIGRQNYQAVTDDIVAGIRERRDALRRWPWWRNPKQRRLLIEYCRCDEELLSMKYDLTLKRPTWKLSDLEFADLVFVIQSKRDL